MESLRHFISFFLKAAVAIVLVVGVWMLVKVAIPPNITIVGITSTSTKKIAGEGWLPSPRTYSGFLHNKPPIAHSNVYVPGPAFNGTANVANNTDTSGPYTFSAFTYSGSGQAISTNGSSSHVNVQSGATEVGDAAHNNSAAVNRNLIVRNLSIYEGGRIYTGLSFIGEIRNTFFRDGKFPIVVVDQTGRVIGVSTAAAQTDWSVPGWTRFQTKITYPLPNNVSCIIIFQEALSVGENTRQPNRVSIPVQCN